MRLQELVTAAVEMKRVKEKRAKCAVRYLCRVPEEVVIAIAATSLHCEAIAKSGGDPLPSYDELWSCGLF